jgi:hypothetical protein
MFRNNDGLTTLRDLIHHSEDEIYASEIYASDGTGTFEFMCQTKLVLLESCFLKAPDPPDA